MMPNNILVIVLLFRGVITKYRIFIYFLVHINKVGSQLEPETPDPADPADTASAQGVESSKPSLSGFWCPPIYFNHLCYSASFLRCLVFTSHKHLLGRDVYCIMFHRI